MLAGIGVGLTDEWIQSWTPGREASLYDLVADCGGLLLGVGLGHLLASRLGRTRQGEAGA